jgi:hypothetical protein
LFRFERGNIIGDEDMIMGCNQYRTTVKCVSLTGLVGKMKREDFMRLENQTYSWQALILNAKNKEQSINKHLQLKTSVEINIKDSAKPPHAHGDAKRQDEKHEKLMSEKSCSPASIRNTPFNMSPKRTIDLNEDAQISKA